LWCFGRIASRYHIQTEEVFIGTEQYPRLDMILSSSIELVKDQRSYSLILKSQAPIYKADVYRSDSSTGGKVNQYGLIYGIAILGLTSVYCLADNHSSFQELCPYTSVINLKEQKEYLEIKSILEEYNR
tara:strand:+ start:3791 stop:4177 length:387 start_codon:yes stop_codon:yes gene_type:complete